jgi:hypothetical protein
MLMGFFEDLLSPIGNLLGLANDRDEANSARYQQEWLAKNKHRIEVNDLRAAGLNPILSAKFGGANPPGGQVAALTGSSHVSNALQAKKLNAEIDLLKSQTDNNLSQAGLNNANKLLSEATKLLRERQTFTETHKGTIHQQQAETGAIELQRLRQYYDKVINTPVGKEYVPILEAIQKLGGTKLVHSVLLANPDLVPEQIRTKVLKLIGFK